MRGELRQIWKTWGVHPRAARRRANSASVAGVSSEFLEQRCMLSAAMSGSAAVAEVADGNVAADQSAHPDHLKHAKIAKEDIPDLSGTWNFTTHFDDGDVEGILQLTQKGRKVTGTLTNDQQPSEPFKGKFSFSTDREGTILGLLSGKMKNLSIESKRYLKYLADVAREVGVAKLNGQIKTGTGTILMNAVQQF